MPVQLAGCAAPKRLRGSLGRGYQSTPTPNSFQHSSSVEGGFARGPNRNKDRRIASSYMLPPYARGWRVKICQVPCAIERTTPE